MKKPMDILRKIPFLLIFSASVCSSGLTKIIIPHTIIPENGTVTHDTRSHVDPSVNHTEDASIPKPILLSWSFSEELFEPKYSLYLSQDKVFDSTDLRVKDTTVNELSIYNLLNNWTYYWKIGVRESNDSVWETPVFTFTTADVWPRMLYIDGSSNARDIGGRFNKDGILIRQGLYYRSTEYNNLLNISKKGIQQILDLGIVCEIDLRHDHESAKPALPAQIRYFRPEYKKKGGGLSPYWTGIQNCKPQYREVFSQLAKRENYPMIVHCVAGADRAGTVTAILEAILDCTEKQIRLNYQWTSLSIYGSRGYPDSPAIKKWEDLIEGLKSHYSVKGSINYGAYNYLLSTGITPQEIDDIRSIFFEQEATKIIKLNVQTSYQTPKRNSSRILNLKNKTGHIDSPSPYFYFTDLKGRVIAKYNAGNFTPGIYIKIPY
jgi:predicted amino acid-binding ACT domain protein